MAKSGRTLEERLGLEALRVRGVDEGLVKTNEARESGSLDRYTEEGKRVRARSQSAREKWRRVDDDRD